MRAQMFSAPLLSATGLVVALVAFPAAPVHAQTLPQGSYVRTCSNARMDNAGVLSADCLADNGTHVRSSIRAADCRADIANRNGSLVCTAGLGSGALGQIADALLGGLTGQAGQTNQPLYQDGYRYPDYGQPGYGDPRYDPRFNQQGWGYGRNTQWVPITERRAWLETRIDTGVRQGRLNAREPAELRRSFEDLVRLETQFARGGLTNSERADLDRRFDQIAARVRITAYDDGGWPGSSWRSVAERRTDFEQAVADAQSRRRITRTEAARLRADFEGLIDLEESYRRDNIDRYERGDLDQRYDALLARTGSTGGTTYPSNGWNGPTIAEQAASIDAQIENQRRAGRLSRTEAARLGDELDSLVRLEQDYRRDTLSRQESDDLSRRLQDLNNRINIGVVLPAVQGPVADRRDGLLSRIDAAVRGRRLSSQEGTRLRTELDELARLELDYGRDGLSAAERNYLEGRLNALEAFVPR